MSVTKLSLPHICVDTSSRPHIEATLPYSVVLAWGEAGMVDLME